MLAKIPPVIIYWELYQQLASQDDLSARKLIMAFCKEKKKCIKSLIVSSYCFKSFLVCVINYSMWEKSLLLPLKVSRYMF